MKKECDENPPPLTVWLMKQLAWDVDREAILDNLKEEYVSRISITGRLVARWWYRWQVLRSIVPFMVFETQWRIGMLKNYFKIAYRNMLKNHTYSLITVTGLSIGLACFLLIMHFIRWELSFDDYHEKAGRIYRVIVKRNTGTFNYGKTTMAVIPSPMAKSMAEDFPEIEQITRLHRANHYLFNYKEKKFSENGLIVDEQFLNVFTFPLKKGDVKTALNAPLTMVITETLGQKYFGDEDPMNKTIIVPYGDNKFDLKITGILEEVPKNSHM